MDFEYKVGGIKGTGLKVVCDKSHFESETVGLRQGHGVQLSATLADTVELCTDATKLYGFTLQSVKDWDGGALPGYRPPAYTLQAQLGTELVGIGYGAGEVECNMVLPSTTISASGTYTATAIAQGDYVKFNVAYSLLQATTDKTNAIGQVRRGGQSAVCGAGNKARPGDKIYIKMFSF